MFAAAIVGLAVPCHAADAVDSGCAETPDGCDSPSQPVATEHTARPSGAPVEAGPFAEPGLAVNAHFGIATPYGGAGAALEASLLEWLSIEGGAGLGSSGPQFALMPRLRLVLGDERRNAFGASVGLSAGPYATGDGEGGLREPLSAMGHSRYDTKVWDLAWWQNTELGWERRPRSGRVTLRVYGGVGMLLNRDDYRCEGDSGEGCHASRGTTLLYAGVALGMRL